MTNTPASRTAPPTHQAHPAGQVTRRIVETITGYRLAFAAVQRSRRAERARADRLRGQLGACVNLLDNLADFLPARHWVETGDPMPTCEEVRVLCLDLRRHADLPPRPTPRRHR
jgi:hypothetical protein